MSATESVEPATQEATIMLVDGNTIKASGVVSISEETRSAQGAEWVVLKGRLFVLAIPTDGILAAAYKTERTEQ